MQGCDSSFTRDIVNRSVTQTVLPIGPIRLPPNDTGSVVQASIALTGMSRSLHPVELQHGSGSNEYGIDGGNNSYLTLSTIQGSGALNVWTERGLRVGLSIDASRVGNAFGFETGIRIGRSANLELFAGIGAVNSYSSVDWRIQSTWYNDEYPRVDTTNKSVSNSSEETRFFGRTGIHLGARKSGPWGELVLLSQNLFDAPTSKYVVW
jgi:hypothetical protein